MVEQRNVASVPNNHTAMRLRYCIETPTGLSHGEGKEADAETTLINNGFGRCAFSPRHHTMSRPKVIHLLSTKPRLPDTVKTLSSRGCLGPVREP